MTLSPWAPIRHGARRYWLDEDGSYAQTEAGSPAVAVLAQQASSGVYRVVLTERDGVDVLVREVWIDSLAGAQLVADGLAEMTWPEVARG